jgi:hypothetical protein
MARKYSREAAYNILVRRRNFGCAVKSEANKSRPLLYFLYLCYRLRVQK